MTDFKRSTANHESNIISLVERRNKGLIELLKDLSLEIKIVKDGLNSEFEEIGEMINLPFLEDHKIDENVIDLATFKKNKQIKDKNEIVSNQAEIIKKIHDLVVRTNQAMNFLYKHKFSNILKSSHVVGDAEMNTELDTDDFQKFSDKDFLDNKIFISLKNYFPSMLDLLGDVNLEVSESMFLIQENQLNNEQLKRLLCQLRDDFQNGLKFSTYFLENFEKNNHQ